MIDINNYLSVLPVVKESDTVFETVLSDNVCNNTLTAGIGRHMFGGLIMKPLIR